MADWYKSFAELQSGETEGIDYRICVTERESETAIIAPHGGWIEPGTSEIAAAIAEDNYGLYCFEGLRKRPHEELHIKSIRFDEPECLGLITRYQIVVSVHGLKGNRCAVDVGGLDVTLRDAICRNLEATGFQSKVVCTGKHAARSPANVCNKGRRRKGVQLEITRGLRDALRDGDKDLNTFAESVRQAISSHRTS